MPVKNKRMKKPTKPQDKNTLGIASLALGIASIAFPIPLIGLALGVLGIIFAVKQRKTNPNPLALAGMITSIAGTVIGALILLILIMLIPAIVILGIMALQ